MFLMVVRVVFILRSEAPEYLSHAEYNSYA